MCARVISLTSHARTTPKSLRVRLLLTTAPRRPPGRTDPCRRPSSVQFPFVAQLRSHLRGWPAVQQTRWQHRVPGVASSEGCLGESSLVPSRSIAQGRPVDDQILMRKQALGEADGLRVRLPTFAQFMNELASSKVVAERYGSAESEHLALYWLYGLADFAVRHQNPLGRVTGASLRRTTHLKLVGMTTPFGPTVIARTGPTRWL